MRVVDPRIGITFGANGNYREFDLEGISTSPDPDTAWTVEPHARIGFRLINPRQIAGLMITARPYLGNGKIKVQRCWVHINGIFVNFGVYRPDGDKEIGAQDALRVGTNTLSLVLPDAVSPNELGLGSDLRVLGLALKEISFIAQPLQNVQSRTS